MPFLLYDPYPFSDESMYFFQLLTILIFYTCYQHLQEMSLCKDTEKMKGDTEAQNLRRQIYTLQDTVSVKVQEIIRLQQDRSKLVVEHGLEKQRIIADSFKEISKAKQQLYLLNKQIEDLKRKESMFIDGYEKDIFDNLKTIKLLQQQILATNDLNRLEELPKEKDISVLINFRSLQALYSSNSNTPFQNSTFEMSCKEIYFVYTAALYQEKKLMLCIGFYVDFLQKVIQNGYDQSSDDRRITTAKDTLQRIAEDLYKKFQEVIKIAKVKFTKERSRILEEQGIDNSHEEMKLREKIDSLQKAIQHKDSLIKELQNFNTTIQRYEKITISNLKEQLNKKEAQQIKEIKSILIELKSIMVQKSDIVGLQRRMQGEAPSQEAELIELMKGKDLKIQELQQKVFQLEKYKSEWSEETHSQSKRITNESIEKDREIGILKKILEEGQEEKHKLSIENAKFAQKQSSLRRQMVDKEETFSNLNQQIETLKKENAQLVVKNKELNQKKDAETKKLQELTSKLTFMPLTLDESSKKIQDLENQLQSLKKQPLHTSGLSETLQSSLEQSSKQQEQLTKKIQYLNTRVNELTRLLEEKEAQLLEQNLKTREASLRADSAENKQNELESQLKMEVKQHNKTKDLLSEANRSLEDVIDQKKKVELQLELSKKELLEEKKAKDKLIKQLQDQKDLAKALQQKIQNGGNAGMTGRFRSASFVQHRTLFIGDILEKRKPEKKFLMDSIETHMKQEIEKTNKLYEYKRDHKTNFHQFIDGHSNIALIVETESALIACYYSGQMQAQVASVMDEQALIVSLDSRKVYKLNNSYNYPNRDPRDTRIMRGMVYDPYYLIFGNAEVRIRSGQNKVFCNFGINNGYFNSQRDRAADLLKVKNKNEVEFINYEIHEIFFNEEYMLQRVQ